MPTTSPLRPGDRVVVMRPQKPFRAVVDRVNARSLAVVDERGRRWRVPPSYPVRRDASRAGPASPAPRAARATGVRPGDRIVVLRPQRPFRAVVDRVNARSLGVTDERGRRWRIGHRMPIRIEGHSRATAAPPQPPRPRRPRLPDIRLPAGRAPATRGRGLAATVAARAAAIAASLPRERAHFMEGGHGITGTALVKVPGVRQELTVLSSNGDYSEGTMWSLIERLRSEFQGLRGRVWID